MLTNKYPKPPLELRHWCVSRKDLYMIHRFVADLFPAKRATILLETRAGNHRAYADFAEFADDIEIVLSRDDEVRHISILEGEMDPRTPERRRYIWLNVDFQFNSASFSIFATDADGSFAEWVENAHKEMRRLFELFRPQPNFAEILKRDFSKVQLERRSDASVVVMDYDGNIKDRIHRELADGKRRLPEFPLKKAQWRGFWREPNLRLSFLTAFVVLLLLIALLAR